jgi:uncharacterized protein
MESLLIRVADIPEGGMRIEIPCRGLFADWKKDPHSSEVHTVIGGVEWQGELLGIIEEPDLSFPHGFEGVVSVVKKNENVIATGRLITVAERACSRCTELFEKKLDISFRSVFTHTGINEKDIELSAEDLDLNFFHGDQFDVGEVITEQISLNLPIKPLCHDDCLGLCVRCGKNLNSGICSCKDEHIDIRFEKLKGLHIK